MYYRQLVHLTWLSVSFWQTVERSLTDGIFLGRLLFSFTGTRHSFYDSPDNYLKKISIFPGAKYKDDCPVEPFIPIYLIVGGSFGMLKTIIVLCQRARTHEDDADIDEDQSMSTKFIDGVLNLFLFTWFIAGNIWVYSKYRPNPTPPPSDPLNYCNPTLYLFAFWVITASYILMGSICFCICCLGVCASCTAFFVTAKD